MSRLRRSQNQEIDALDPIALSGLVIMYVIPSDLEQDDVDFVTDEFNWLFHAMKNFQEIYQIYQARVRERLSPSQQETRKKEFRQQFLAKVPSGQRAKRSGEAVDYSHQQLEQFVAATKQNLWREAATGHEVIDWPIPAEAETGVGANNQAQADPRAIRKVEQLEGTLHKRAPFESELQRLKAGLKNLRISLDQAAALGPDGQIDRRLQTGIQSSRSGIAQTMVDIAKELSPIYGVLVTAPEQLLALLEKEL